MDKRELFQYLKLKTYNDEEMDQRFGRICSFDNISVSRSVSNSDDVESNNHDHLNVITEQNLAEFILD
jgi:hypothetical protein